MPVEYLKDGIRFLYPESWEIDHEEFEGGWSINLQSPSTAFLSLIYREDETDPAVVADSVLEAMKEEYPSLESDSVVETIANLPAVGYDLACLTLDLPVTIQVRAMPCEEGVLLLMIQSADLDLEAAGPVFDAIQASLRLDE